LQQIVDTASDSNQVAQLLAGIETARSFSHAIGSGRAGPLQRNGPAQAARRPKLRPDESQSNRNNPV
jgi:hypothetical protein